MTQQFKFWPFARPEFISGRNTLDQLICAVIRLIKSWPFFKCRYSLQLRSCLFFFSLRPFVDSKSYGRYSKIISLLSWTVCSLILFTFAGFAARQRFTAVSFYSMRDKRKPLLSTVRFIILPLRPRSGPSSTYRFGDLSIPRLLILSDFLNTICSPQTFVSDSLFWKIDKNVALVPNKTTQLGISELRQ